MIHIRPMTFSDLPLGLRLRQQAGWNQTPADWARFLTLQPGGCFVAELDGRPAGTTTTCVLGEVGWIGMVLVDEHLRRRGIGWELVNHALQYLTGLGIRSIRLDATGDGVTLYRRAGFVAQFPLSRHEGLVPAQAPVDGVDLGRPQDWESVFRLDREVTGTDRRKLLTALFVERPDDLRVVRRGGTVIGYLTHRRGARGVQLGPLIATAEAAPLLLADACHRLAGRQAFIDVPVNNGPAIQQVRALGFREQRQLLRMYRGDTVEESVMQLWASSGPEKG